MKLVIALIFIFLLSLSITYTKNLAFASRVGMVIDRVCTKQIDKDKTKTYKIKGRKYYFCSKRCKKTFKKNPEKYPCMCPATSDGCPCFHCTGSEELCDCAELTVYTESHAGGHEHEQEEKDEGHGH